MKTITRDNLNDLMECDHVIQVHADGTVTEPSGVYAPSYRDDELEDDTWTLMSIGYTGQWSYNGPVMHDSESIGGRMADDILSTPGYYVAVPASWTPTDDDEEDPEEEDIWEGWVVAYRETI